jgi:hypothetical protein
VALGMERNATKANLHFVPRKVFFPFLECRNHFFCEAATETRDQKLGKTTHINSRPPGIRIPALISLRQPSEVYFEFGQAPADFVEPGWFCTLALKSQPPNFLQK